MSNRLEHPEVEPITNIIDQLIEILGLAIVVGSFVVAGWSYFQLSGGIPIHFNVAGQPNAYGTKVAIFVPPIISAALFIFFTFLNRFPWLFNYPTPITVANACYQYTIAARLVRVLKTVVASIFAYLVVATYFTAKGHSLGFGKWPGVIAVIFIFGPLIVAIVKMFRGR